MLLREGFGVIARNADLRKLAVAPLLISAGVLFLVWILAVGVGGGALGNWIGSVLPWLAQAAPWIGRVIVAVGLWFLTSTLFIHFALLAGAHFWDELSFRVEQRVMGHAPRQPISFPRIALEIAMRTMFALCFAVTGLLFGWLFAGIVGVFLAGTLAFFDLTAAAFARRGVLFPVQIFKAMNMREALWFIPVAGVVALVPILNIMLLPGLLSTATLVVARRHQSR